VSEISQSHPGLSGIVGIPLVAELGRPQFPLGDKTAQAGLVGGCVGAYLLGVGVIVPAVDLPLVVVPVREPKRPLRVRAFPSFLFGEVVTLVEEAKGGSRALCRRA
jgi:hypothetical protein